MRSDKCEVSGLDGLPTLEGFAPSKPLKLFNHERTRKQRSGQMESGVVASLCEAVFRIFASGTSWQVES